MLGGAGLVDVGAIEFVNGGLLVLVTGRSGLKIAL